MSEEFEDFESYIIQPRYCVKEKKTGCNCCHNEPKIVHTGGNEEVYSSYFGIGGAGIGDLLDNTYFNFTSLLYAEIMIVIDRFLINIYIELNKLNQNDTNIEWLQIDKICLIYLVGLDFEYEHQLCSIIHSISISNNDKLHPYWIKLENMPHCAYTPTSVTAINSNEYVAFINMKVFKYNIYENRWSLLIELENMSECIVAFNDNTNKLYGYGNIIDTNSWSVLVRDMILGHTNIFDLSYMYYNEAFIEIKAFIYKDKFHIIGIKNQYEVHHFMWDDHKHELELQCFFNLKDVYDICNPYESIKKIVVMSRRNKVYMFFKYDIWCYNEYRKQWKLLNVSRPWKLMNYTNCIITENERYIISFGGKNDTNYNNIVYHQAICLLDIDSMEWFQSDIPTPTPSEYQAICMYDKTNSNKFIKRFLRSIMRTHTTIIPVDIVELIDRWFIGLESVYLLTYDRDEDRQSHYKINVNDILHSNLCLAVFENKYFS